MRENFAIAITLPLYAATSLVLLPALPSALAVPFARKSRDPEMHNYLNSCKPRIMCLIKLSLYSNIVTVSLLAI